MDAQYITIKTVKLNNNCPECYSKDGLELTFKQKFNCKRSLKLEQSDSELTVKTQEYLNVTECFGD